MGFWNHPTKKEFRMEIITLEGNARTMLLHPDIEGVMQEQVGQQRADNSTLRSALLPSYQRTIR